MSERGRCHGLRLSPEQIKAMALCKGCPRRPLCLWIASWRAGEIHDSNLPRGFECPCGPCTTVRNRSSLVPTRVGVRAEGRILLARQQAVFNRVALEAITEALEEEGIL